MKTDYSKMKPGEVYTKMDFSEALLAFKAGCVIVRDCNRKRQNSFIKKEIGRYNNPYFKLVIDNDYRRSLNWKPDCNYNDLLANDWVIARDEDELDEFFNTPKKRRKSLTM